MREFVDEAVNDKPRRRGAEEFEEEEKFEEEGVDSGVGMPR